MARKLTQKIRNFVDDFDWVLNETIPSENGNILVYTTTYSGELTQEAKEWNINHSKFNQDDTDNDVQVRIIEINEKENEMLLDLFYSVYENNPEDERNIIFEIYDSLTLAWGLQ